MLTIEEYITRRKKELKINEFDSETSIENARAINKIVNDYFEIYLKENMYKVIRTSNQLNNFRKQISHYSVEVQDYLVETYSLSGNYLHRPIENLLKNEKFLFIRDTNAEFNELTQKAIAALNSKLPQIQIDSYIINKLIKEYIEYQKKWYINGKVPTLLPEINNWIAKTQLNYNVSLCAFAADIAEKFFDEDENWPQYRKSIDKVYTNSLSYNYDFRTEGNRFNLDELYEQMPEKIFLNNKRKYLEVLVMYYWLHSIYGGEDYWYEYIKDIT